MHHREACAADRWTWGRPWWVVCALTAGALVAAARAESLQPACLTSTAVRALQRAHPELTGARVRLGLIELARADENGGTATAYWPMFEHASLQGARVGGLYGQAQSGPASWHASMIAALLVGRAEDGWCGAVGDLIYRGAAPDAVLTVYQTGWFIREAIFGWLLGGADLPLEQDVLSISWGSDSQDGISETWQRGIDALAAEQGCVVVAAAGNGAADFEFVSKPACGYNVISVGSARALGATPERLVCVGPPGPEHSSFGPTADDRCKPDLIAPGVLVGPSLRAVDAYCVADGQDGYSSFAAPQVAGVAALLIDAARMYGWIDADDGRVIKAVLLNGANKLVGWQRGFPGPQDDAVAPLDYGQGAGLVNAVGSFRQLLAGRYRPEATPAAAGWDLAAVSLAGEDPNSSRRYELGVVPAGRRVKATLTWYQRYVCRATCRPEPLEVLNLALWSVDAHGRLEELLDYSASPRDNVQHVDYAVAAPRALALVVSAPGGSGRRATETYALAFCTDQENWSGDQDAADLNADGIVNVEDLMRWSRAWTSQREGKVEPGLAAADINADGRIDETDFQLISARWQRRSWWYRR